MKTKVYENENNISENVVRLFRNNGILLSKIKCFMNGILTLFNYTIHVLTNVSL